ncbi:MAG TPA: isoprenoid biosynthesis glyoxalase ElbB [Gammaproteobacteria bacterium]|nr:isoprenoid biosynthesis glyoxalase ElbB [Gammaproteobacteria bacterium]
MKPIAVILSGCGVFDGSEIYETVITLLALDRAGATYQCLAPALNFNVVNHVTQQASGEQREVYTEAARLARGNIKPLGSARADDYAAMIIPGGFGAAKNLSDFAQKGKDATVNPELLAFAKGIAQQHKPAGFICIAPTLISAIYGAGVELTIGTDEKTASVLTAMGAFHKSCSVTEYVADAQHKVVTTPAYMLAQSISQAAFGIERLVEQVLAWAE